MNACFTLDALNHDCSDQAIIIRNCLLERLQVIHRNMHKAIWQRSERLLLCWLRGSGKRCKGATMEAIIKRGGPPFAGGSAARSPCDLRTPTGIRRRAGIEPRPYGGLRNVVGSAVDEGKGR